MSDLSDSSLIQQAVAQLPPCWLKSLADDFELPHMQALQAFLTRQRQQGRVIYPPPEDIFNAFGAAPLADVKVVILGQDPYHGPEQAHGLCFSVREGIKPPPSLVNIFKEIQRDLAIELPAHGCLQSWAEQGVLLLNATLTVEQAQAGSHQGQGWEQFTDRVVQLLNEQRQGLVFLLWGAHAQKKGRWLDRTKHLVLNAPHPSPLSAHRGFFGQDHFSKANDYLQQQGLTPIDWRLD